MPTWLRVVALAALAWSVVAAVRRQRLRPGERNALMWLTLAVVVIVAGVLTWANSADGR